MTPTDSLIEPVKQLPAAQKIKVLDLVTSIQRTGPEATPRRSPEGLLAGMVLDLTLEPCSM